MDAYGVSDVVVNKGLPLNYREGSPAMLRL